MNFWGFRVLTFLGTYFSINILIRRFKIQKIKIFDCGLLFLIKKFYSRWQTPVFCFLFVYSHSSLNVVSHGLISEHCLSLCWPQTWQQGMSARRTIPWPMGQNFSRSFKSLIKSAILIVVPPSSSHICGSQISLFLAFEARAH